MTQSHHRVRAFVSLILLVSWLVPLLPTAALAALSAQTIDAVSFPGDYASHIGGAEWMPADPTVQATDEDGDGVWTLTVVLPGGRYEFKAALNGTWDLNYGLDGEQGGDNLPLEVPAEGGTVTFFFDATTNAVSVEVEAVATDEEGTPVLADGNIGRAGLHHDSRSDLYRVPFGAVPTETAVTLRFRTYADDVEAVRLVLQNEGTGNRSAQALQAVATQPGDPWAFTLWETTINSGDVPTIHTYTFEIQDGDSLLSYVDNGDGGPGLVSVAAPGQRSGWDIYTYVPDFDAPEWAKNAVIYQIFPDRFRNGRAENDPSADDWFYPDERGHAFPVEPWNTIVPDPMPADPAANPEWYATWSSTFYGGDLQGILEKLDYLQALGVTALYLNPIFESPSNHRYDGRSFDQVDDSLGIEGDADASLAVLEELGTAAAERNMHIILDGVPNHMSSDASIFDKFGRYTEEGACESADSPWRDWFFFRAPSGAERADCAGDMAYTKWAGVSTLPQRDNANPDVIADWLDADEGVAVQWLRIPGVDGWRIDVVPDVVGLNPRFFEQFRSVVKAEDPDAILYSETWQEPDVRARVLGDEFDSTMNYRFRAAVLGFVRGNDWEDGDGTIPGLSAHAFDDALRAIQEDYPPAAWQSAMNLISSHDVNRAVRVLDADGVDYTTLEPINRFADGRRRLRLAAVLQFTLPGAPTVYYGDEVGLVGFGSDIPRDDPYNRQPYPWPDAAGYEDLPDWRKQHEDLLGHYQFLGQLRAEHSFLRTGEWATLLADDNGLYVYGRKDASGAAIVAVNRGDAAATAALDLAGYLPDDATLVEAVSGDESEVPLAFEIAPLDFRIWLTAAETDLTAPDTPEIVRTAESNGQIVIEVSSDDKKAVQLLLYRSPVNGGYEIIESVDRSSADESVTFTDATVENGRAYFYGVAAVGENGMSSPPSAPLRLIPRYTLADARLLEPLRVDHPLSAITPTVPIQGQITITDVTEGPAAGVVAELGMIKADPDTVPDFSQVIWTPADYVGAAEGGAIYATQLLPEEMGTYLYGWRFSTTGGDDWIYADAGGLLAELPWTEPGRLDVVASADSKAPNRPFRISEVFASPAQIVVEWRASRTADLHHYRLCRQDLTAGEEEACTTPFIVPPSSRIFTDTAVLIDHTYAYTVQSVDSSFNRSEPSDTVEVTAAENFVEVTFEVRVPDFTPANDSVVIAGDNADVFGGQWSPVQPMTRVADNVWAFTAVVKEGTPLQYKYTRGSWETVEQWDSMAGMANRGMVVTASAEGTQQVDNTFTDWGEGDDAGKAVRNWRDPLVTAMAASADAVEVTFNAAIVATGDLDVVTVTTEAGEAVAGSVEQINQTTFTFTPDEALAAGNYAVTVFHVATDVPMVQPYAATFSVE